MSTFTTEVISDPPQPLLLRWSAMTHPGRFRPNNEDVFLALAFDGRDVRYLGKTGEFSLAGSDCVFAVSDGMGGARSGEFASLIAKEQIARLMPRGFRLGAGGMASDFQDILGELFATIHAEMTRMGESYGECAGMGATLSLCWFAPGRMRFGHIGDSRIYYLPDGGALRQLTDDHSHVGWLRRAGHINEREARTHPRRNALQQSLGGGHQFIEPQIGAVSVAACDRFLVCSDGLIDGVWDRRIGEALRATAPGENLAGALVTEAVESSGRDNATAIVIEVVPCPSSLSTAL